MQIKGVDGQAGALTLSQADSEQLVDFEVTSSSFHRGPEPNTLQQTIDFVLFFEQRAQFHRMTVKYHSPKQGQSASVSSSRIWTKDLSEATVAGEGRKFEKIGKLLTAKAISTVGKSHQLAYSNSIVAFKALLMILNDKGKWEVCLFEVDLDHS